jgi:TolA-binding protein
VSNRFAGTLLWATVTVLFLSGRGKADDKPMPRYWQQATGLEAGGNYDAAIGVWMTTAKDSVLPLESRREAYQHAELLRAFFTVPIAPADDTWRAHLPIAGKIVAGKENSTVYPASDVRIVALWIMAKQDALKDESAAAWDLLERMEDEYAGLLRLKPRWRAIAAGVNDLQSNLADAAFQKKDYAKASGWYRHLIEQHPADAQVALWKARVAAMEKEPAALFEQAQQCRQRNKPAEAVKLYQDLLTRFPYSVFACRAQFALGAACAETGDYAKAVEELRKVSQLIPEDSLALTAMLRIASYFRGPLNDLEAALKEYEGVLRLFPTDPHADQAFFAVGAIYEEVGEPDKAKAVWKQLINSFPKSPLAEEAKKQMKDEG